MNSENSKTSKPHVLILNLTDKINLSRVKKNIALSSPSIYYTWKNMKSSYNNNKSEKSAPTWNDKFEFPDGSYSYQIFKIILGIFKKKHKEKIDNPSIRIYVNKIKNRITFKIKTGYYLELLTPETIRLLGSTGNKITKHTNDENVPHLEIKNVVLLHCCFVNNDYQQDSTGSLLEIAPTIY